MTDILHSGNLVSIIMPCLNAEHTIVEAIESVLSQDYDCLELIIIDDGSSDATVEIIKKFQQNDRRITLLINTKHHGVAEARNIGINSAKGKYICFLDSDDFLLPSSISLRVKTSIARKCNIVYGDYLRLLPDGKLVRKSTPLRITLGDMLRRNYIGNLTGMYDAEAIGKMLQQSIRHEDYLMWCKLISKEKFALSAGNAPIAVYRVSSNSLSGNKLKAFFWHWNVLRNGLGINFFASLYYQSYYFGASLLDRLIDEFRRRMR
jgi:teichuronic acid biosynthesis glycosyltransferase TuaG